MVPGHQNTPDHPLVRLLGAQALAADISPLVNGIGKGPNNPLQQSLALASEVTTDTKLLKLPCMSESSMSIRDAYYSDTEVVAYEDAIGRISAESLAAYPPGIPNVLPVEIITEEIAVFLKATAETPGGWVRGAVNPQASAFRVVK